MGQGLWVAQESRCPLPAVRGEMLLGDAQAKPSPPQTLALCFPVRAEDVPSSLQYEDVYSLPEFLRARALVGWKSLV